MMAIWIKVEQVDRVHGELLELARAGETFVVFEKGLPEYGVMDFIPGKSGAEVKAALAFFENGKVMETALLIAQLETAMKRGITDWAVLPEFSAMGLEEGNIYSDLRMMGLKEPVLEQLIYEAGDKEYAQIALNRKIGELEVGLRLYRVDINGEPRLPEFAIVVPKVLDKVPLLKSEFGDSSTLESELKRTVSDEQQQQETGGEKVFSTMAMATRAAQFMGPEWIGATDPQFSLRCQAVATLLGKYSQGKQVGEVLLSLRPEYFRHLYTSVPFPYTVKVNEVVKLMNSPEQMMEISRRAFENENLRKAIMEAKNLENLKNEMTALGFSKNLIGQMEAKMAANEQRFILYDELQTDKGRMEVGLHFNQSRSSAYYYLNKFDLVLEKQPPLEVGETYFVASQRQGEEVQVLAFEMPSLAVKHFNTKLEGAKEIRGTAQLFSGTDLNSAKQLVSMKDGFVIHLEKDFYKTLKNPSPSQTFYLEKGNGFTLEQAANMLAGRSVERDNILDINKHEYSAWAKLDFDAGRDRSGNYPIKTFTEGYGFDLGAVLDRFDFKELSDAELREKVEASMRNGNRAEVTVDLNGKTEKILAVAIPEFKQINLYALDGQSIKRETHLKVEQGAEASLGKGKSAKKAQEQGLGV